MISLAGFIFLATVVVNSWLW